jgi:hypothetical protein
MNANLLPEGWKIGKRIESGSYLGCKFTVAESLTSRSSARTKRRELIPRGCGCSTVGGPTEVLKDPPAVEMKAKRRWISRAQ